MGWGGVWERGEVGGEMADYGGVGGAGCNCCCGNVAKEYGTSSLFKRKISGRLRDGCFVPRRW